MAPTLSDVAATLARLYVTAPDLSPSEDDILSFTERLRYHYDRMPWQTYGTETDPGFTSWQQISEHAIAHRCFPVWRGNPAPWMAPHYTMMQRSIHDWLHVKLQADFTFAGELRVLAAECALFDQPIHRAILFSDFLQGGAYATTHGHFPAQRLVRCSDELIQSAVKLGEAF